MNSDQPNTSAEAAIGAPVKRVEHKPKRTSAPRPSKAAKAVEAETETETDEPLYEITLHDSKEIPPNGQFVGINGRQFLIKPGVRVKVPASVLGVLDNATQAVPEVNEKMQVIGMREAPRLTYTLHRE